MSASPPPVLLVKAVRRGDTRTIDLFGLGDSAPKPATAPPAAPVNAPAASPTAVPPGVATAIKQLPIKVITRKDGHTQTYHVAPEEAAPAKPAFSLDPEAINPRERRQERFQAIFDALSTRHDWSADWNSATKRYEHVVVPGSWGEHGRVVRIELQNAVAKLSLGTETHYVDLADNFSPEKNAERINAKAEEIIAARRQAEGIDARGRKLPKAAPAAKTTTTQPTHYRVHLTSPFGEFAVYVRADKQASLDDYRKDAKTAMVTDMGAAALSWSSQAQIKVVGEPEPVSSVPDNASQVRLAAWAHIAKVERTPAAQTDRTALLDDKEDLADEMLRNPHSAKAKELEARIAAAEGQTSNPPKGDITRSNGQPFKDHASAIAAITRLQLSHKDFTPALVGEGWVVRRKATKLAAFMEEQDPPATDAESLKGIEAVPDDVLNGVKRAVNRLQEIRGSADRAIENLDKRFGGEGRYESDVLWETREDIVSSMAAIDEFRFYAPQNDVDAEKVLKELGGVPDLTPTAQAAKWLHYYQEKELKWQEGEVKAKTESTQKRSEADDRLPATEAEAMAAIDRAKRDREEGEVKAEEVQQKGLAAVYSDQEMAEAWTRMGEKNRLLALRFHADMQYRDGRATTKARQLAKDSDWLALPEEQKNAVTMSVRLWARDARNKAERLRAAEASRPKEVKIVPPKPRYDPNALEQTIGGVQFRALRYQRPLPHWRLQVVPTGVVYEAGTFNSKTKARLWDDVDHLLRIKGQDDFQQQMLKVYAGAVDASGQPIATTSSKIVAKAINRHLGQNVGDLLAPLQTATVMIPTYTKEDGTVVTAHPAKVKRRVKTVTATNPRQAALEAAIDHLSTDSRQKDIPKDHRQEDAAAVAKLKRVMTQSPQKQEQALKEVVEHLKEDRGSPKLSAAEHKEDQALTDQLKAAVAPEALPPIKFDKRSPKDLAAAGYREFETQYRGITTEDLQHRLRFQQSRYPEADFVLYRNTGGDISLWWRPEGKPKPKWSEEPAPAGEILARYPNRADGVEGRVVPRADGRYAAILWDADADHAVGIKIFPDLERAQEQARRMANAPAADAPDDLPPSVQPDPAEPEPTRAALTPTERDVQSYTQHLTTPAVILAAATLRHQLGIQDQLRAMVALSTGKVPGAAELTATERATAAWLAASLPLTHRVYSRIPQGNGGWSGVSRDEPITAAAHLDGESVRDALLLELGYGRQFINARPADAFSDLGVQWGALRATDGDQGYFDSTPAAWARRVRHFIDSKAALARAQYLLGSAAWLTPKTPGDKAGVMAEITRLGLATPEQFEQGLERHFSLTAPLKKEVQGGAPSREDLIAGTRGLDDLVLYRLVGTLNQAKVHAFATAVKTLQGRLRPALAGLDPKDAGYWAAYRQALTATGWQEVKVNSAFNRKQVFALQAPGGGLVELGLRSFANASPVFAFPGEPRTYLHRAPDRLSAISQYLETLGALRPPTSAEVAAAQPKEQRPAPERVPVTYAPVALAKRGPSPAAFYGRATRADMDSGAKAIRTLMRQDLKRGLAAGRLPTGIQVSITGDARSIDLRLTGVPEGMPVLNPAWVVARANGFDPEYGEERVPRYAPATQQVLDDLEAIFRKYRWDESDSMTDYFRANYWGGAAVSYQLEDRYDHLVPKASQATPGDTVTIDGVTYRLSGEPPRWHRADQVPPSHPAPRGPAKVVKVTATPGPEARQRQADKLRAAADSLAARAQATQAAERLTNTARRARMASGALEQAAKQAALAESARHLATALAAGEVTHLAKVNSLAAVETLDSLLQDAMYRRDRERWAYRERERNQGRPAEAADLDYVTWPQGEATVARLQRLGILQQSELRAALGEYLTHRAGAKALDPVQAAELAIAGQKVGVDFFPTPKPLAARMATLAGIKPGMRVLEPSAGNGHLADAARARGAEVDAVEVSDALRTILDAKGHRLAGRDFTTFTAEQPYDAILMNPPFSDRQDAAHIQRAWELLKPGGTLVAIAGEGVFFGQDRAAQAFRGWLDERGAEVEKLPAGSFLDRTLPQTTGVNARLLILRKPAGMVAKALFASSPTWRLPYLPRLTLVRRAA